MILGDLFEKDSLKLPDIEIDDEVKIGKFLNRKAVVKGFTTDDHNQPILKTNKGNVKLFKPRITKLDEKFVQVTINSKWHNDSELKLLQNPTATQLLKFLHLSVERKLRGLIVGHDVYWWDATKSYHAHVAELFDENYPDYDLTKRLQLRTEDDQVVLDMDDRYLSNRHIVSVLKSDEILFYIPGAQYVTYSEYQELVANGNA